MKFMMTPTNVFMALVLIVAIAWILLALILRFLPEVFADLDERTPWGQVGNYFKKALSGIFSPDTNYLLSEGLDLLKHNFLLPVVAFIATVPMAVSQYYMLHRSFPSFSEQAEFQKSFGLSGKLPGEIALFILDKSFKHLIHSLGELNYVLNAFIDLPFFFAAIILSMFLVGSLTNIDRGKYDISPRLAQFYILLAFVFPIVTAVTLAPIVHQLVITDVYEGFSGQVENFFKLANFLFTPITSAIFFPFLSCVLYIFVISQVLGIKLDKRTFWQDVIDCFLPLFYLALFFLGVGLIFAIPIEYKLFKPGEPVVIHEVAGLYGFYLKDTVFTLLNFFFLPFPVVVVMHKLGFWDAVSKLKSWHQKYPERIAGFLLSSWIILFGVSAVMETVNYLLRLQGMEFWLEVLGMELRKIVFILVSSWLVLCMIQLAHELSEADAGVIDAQDPTPADDQPS